MKRFLASISLLFFLAGCSPEEEYSFQEKQSEIVQKFRKEGYYEYNSRLNDVLFAELNSLEQDVISSSMLETIAYISEKLKKEKHSMGCYLIEWDNLKTDADEHNAITLEWHQKHGVIIRMFTKSAKLKQLLPQNSY